MMTVNIVTKDAYQTLPTHLHKLLVYIIYSAFM